MVKNDTKTTLHLLHSRAISTDTVSWVSTGPLLGTKSRAHSETSHDCSRLMASRTHFKASLPRLPDGPHHPPKDFLFPKRTFGKPKLVQCSARSLWFDIWQFLHYDEGQDVVFYHKCHDFQARQNEVEQQRCRCICKSVCYIYIYIYIYQSRSL